MTDRKINPGQTGKVGKVSKECIRVNVCKCVQKCQSVLYILTAREEGHMLLHICPQGLESSVFLLPLQSSLKSEGYSGN